jgi:hypothetical protein
VHAGNQWETEGKSLKNRCPQGLVGSSPTTGTLSNPMRHPRQHAPRIDTPRVRLMLTQRDAVAPREMISHLAQHPLGAKRWTPSSAYVPDTCLCQHLSELFLGVTCR